MSNAKPLFSVPHLGGVKPGVLDPSQPSRILRHPSSVLVFATYDPVAFVTIGIDVGLPPNTRIVVEHTPGPGQANWFRLIPPPRLGPGVQGEEGSWPKVVLLNGKSAIFEQEQWEIYKLDPAYDCFLPSPGELPIITSIGGPSVPPAATPAGSAVPMTKRKGGKGPDLSRQATGSFSSSTSFARSAATGSSTGFASSTDSASSSSSTSSVSSTATIRPPTDEPPPTGEPVMDEHEFQVFLNSTTFKNFIASSFPRMKTSTRGDAPAVNPPTFGGSSTTFGAPPRGTGGPMSSTIPPGFSAPPGPSAAPPEFSAPPGPSTAPPEFSAPPGLSGAGPVPSAHPTGRTPSGFTPAAAFSAPGFAPSAASVESRTTSSAPWPAPFAPTPGSGPSASDADSRSRPERRVLSSPVPETGSSAHASTASAASSLPGSDTIPEAPETSATARPSLGQSSAPAPGRAVVDMSDAFSRDTQRPATRTTGSRARTTKPSKKAAKPYARPPPASTSGPVPEPFFMDAPSDNSRAGDTPCVPKASSFGFHVPPKKRREESKLEPASPSPVRQPALKPLFRPRSNSSETLRSTSGSPAPASSSTTAQRRQRTPEVVDLTMEDEEEDKDDVDADVHETGATKRKRASNPTQPRKRGREVSPATEAADANLKRAQRKRDQMACSQRVETDQTKERDAKLWQEIFAGVRQNGRYSALPAPANQEDGMEVDHDAAIEASKRKLAELAKDQPIWDQESLKRAAEAQAEEARHEQARRDAAEAAAEQECRRLEEAAAEADRRTAEAAMRANQHAQRVQQERKETRRQQRLRWSPWNPSRAIPRYIELSQTFDRAKFTADSPVDPLLIPWPVLRTPFSLQLQDITWEAVESFFAKARATMSIPQYKAFVVASNIRFHPDSWRKMGIFLSGDNAMNEELQAACTMVSQALTPIWKESKTL